MLTVRCALRLAPLVFVRPGELRMAEWKDIDLEAAEWRYTVTKTNTPHIVPLSRQHWRFCARYNPSPARAALFFRGRGQINAR
jgi:integrase